jgi:hypothetical protein
MSKSLTFSSNQPFLVSEHNSYHPLPQNLILKEIVLWKDLAPQIHYLFL